MENETDTLSFVQGKLRLFLYSFFLLVVVYAKRIVSFSCWYTKKATNKRKAKRGKTFV